ncbi:PPOX class F420-dependent enzyme [Kitasatospora sp. NE20-6]
MGQCPAAAARLPSAVSAGRARRALPRPGKRSTLIGMSPSIATSTRVGLDELLEFVRPRHRALLLTRRADGSPQASPLTCGVDAEGRIVVSTYPERAKTRNARRDASVSVVVLSDEWDGPWVQIDGEAEVIDAPESVEPLVEYFRTIAGEHPDWDEYRAAMVRQGKSLIRVTPRRWGPVATGGFPARLVQDPQ